MLLLYLNMLMTLQWCVLLVINVIRLLTLWDNSRHGLKRTTSLAIRKNVKNLSSEVKATILNITPYLTLISQCSSLVLLRGGGALRSRVIASFRRMLISN